MRREKQPRSIDLDGPGYVSYKSNVQYNRLKFYQNEQRNMMPDKMLDARNLNCPLPILKTKRAIDGLEIGGILEVLATDPGSLDDFRAFAESTGHTLLEQSTDQNGVFRFVLRREA